MSKDYRPIDHILVNLELKLRGAIDEVMMEHPYLELTDDKGNVTPLSDKECAEEFPYVTFFTNLYAPYKAGKDNPIYMSKMKTLEDNLRKIVKRAEDEGIKATKEKRLADLSGMFEGMSDDLKQFIMAEGDYAFSYDCSDARMLFSKRFMKDVRDETAIWIADGIISQFELFLMDKGLDIENPERAAEIDSLDDGTRPFTEIQALIESQPLIFGSDRETLEKAFASQKEHILPTGFMSRETAIVCANAITDAFVKIMKDRGINARTGEKIPEGAELGSAELRIKALTEIEEHGFCEKEVPEKYYGVVQASHGHDYVYMFKEEQIPEEIIGLLPSEPGESDVVDIYWPIGGSNSSASSVYVLSGEKEAMDFLTQDCYGPNLEDPTLADLSEYAWSIVTDEGCGEKLFIKYGLDPDDYEQIDRRLLTLCEEYGSDVYKDELGDVRLSEAEEKLPGLIAEMHLEDIAKEAFELETLFIGTSSGGIDPPRNIHSVARNEDGSVSITYSKPAICGLSDVHYHNTDTAEHTATYTVIDGELSLDGDDVFPALSEYSDDYCMSKAAEFFKKWNLEMPEEIAEAMEYIEEDMEEEY